MDPASLIAVASQFGGIGLVFLACGAFVLYRDKTNTKLVSLEADRHVAERKEWRDVIDRQHQECITARHEATAAVVENSAIISKLSTIIETRR